MCNKMIFFKLLGIGLAATFLLGSCQIGATPASPTANPTAATSPVEPTATLPPVPTATEEATPAATATQAATDTATPTAVLSPQVIPAINVNCRKGPALGYDKLTNLYTGTAYPVLGRDSQGTWWLVQVTNDLKCWMGDPNATKLGPVDQVEIVYVPSLPVTPPLFVGSDNCDSTLLTLTVALNWAAVDNVTGYNIYRNGEVVAKVAADATSYGDSPPLGVNLVYELEAYNDYGVALPISTFIPACG